MRLAFTLLAAALALPLAAASAAAQSIRDADGPEVHRLWMAPDPNEFYLYDDSDVAVVDFKSERDVRVCLNESTHPVPLEVSYDGQSAEVRPGDCLVLEAKEVSITPARELREGWSLTGTVQNATR